MHMHISTKITKSRTNFEQCGDTELNSEMKINFRCLSCRIRLILRTGHPVLFIHTVLYLTTTSSQNRYSAEARCMTGLTVGQIWLRKAQNLSEEVTGVLLISASKNKWMPETPTSWLKCSWFLNQGLMSLKFASSIPNLQNNITVGRCEIPCCSSSAFCLFRSSISCWCVWFFRLMYWMYSVALSRIWARDACLVDCC